MNKPTDLKILVLEIIEANNGSIDWNTIQSKVKAHYFKFHVQLPSDEKITHALYLRQKEDAVERFEQIPWNYYKLTPWGHALVGPKWKKWIYFLTYKNSNLVSLIALIISIISLIISKY
jgi:hypothetical protein